MLNLQQITALETECYETQIQEEQGYQCQVAEFRSLPIKYIMSCNILVSNLTL